MTPSSLLIYKSGKGTATDTNLFFSIPSFNVCYIFVYYQNHHSKIRQLVFKRQKRLKSININCTFFVRGAAQSSKSILLCSNVNRIFPFPVNLGSAGAQMMGKMHCDLNTSGVKPDSLLGKGGHVGPFSVINDHYLISIYIRAPNISGICTTIYVCIRLTHNRRSRMGDYG